MSFFSYLFVEYKRSNCDRSYQSKKEVFTEISWKKFLDRTWCNNRNIWLIFENADIEIISKCIVAAKQVVWFWGSWHWWLKCLIFVFWKQWDEAYFCPSQVPLYCNAIVKCYNKILSSNFSTNPNMYCATVKIAVIGWNNFSKTELCLTIVRREDLRKIDVSA